MRSEGLFGFFAGAKVIATPEGGIVSIVETFFKLYVPEMRADPDLTKKRLPADESERRDRAILTRIFAAIENHRSRFYPGTTDYPIDLKEYVAYRIEIEMAALHRIEASSMGLDRETVHQMVDDAATFFKARLDQF